MRIAAKLHMAMKIVSILLHFAFTVECSSQMFINCGDPSKRAYGSDDLEWISDVGSNYISADHNPNSSTTATATVQHPSLPLIPYMTARIFLSETTYTILIAPGRKFIRLHFYPAFYGEFKASDAVFSVISGKFTLLVNFSAARTTKAMAESFIVKEYAINVEEESKTINLTFSPNLSLSPNSYAFVNGIEVISIPNLVYNSHASIVGHNTSSLAIRNSTALETSYRLNMAGNYISGSDDIGGMHRSWDYDRDYIFGAAFGSALDLDRTMKIKHPSDYAAPTSLYETARAMRGVNAHINWNYNLTWIFPVDPGFVYLIRLHFCELYRNITTMNPRQFDIFINNVTAYEKADVVFWSGGVGIPVHKDFVTFVDLQTHDLWLALHPNLNTYYVNVILNGVEIFKVSDMNRNLAAVNLLPDLPFPKPNPFDPSHNKDHNAAIVAGCGLICAALLILGFAIIFRNPWKGSSSISDASSSNSCCRHCSLADKNFDRALLVGVGEFGKIYKAEIDYGTTPLKGSDQQKEINEFQTEIELLKDCAK